MRNRVLAAVLIFNALSQAGVPFTSSVLAAGVNCSSTSTGHVAITDLGQRRYKGEQGGLYTGGANKAPAAYEAAGLQATRAIVPLDGAGNPSANGQIVFLSIGMSNASLEFQGFIRSEATDSARNPSVVMVDGAQFGEAADAWADPNAPTWRAANMRLAGAGFTPQQVEVIWLKEAGAFPRTDFETYAHWLQGKLMMIVQSAAREYPMLRQVFISPRTFGGYGPQGANPEPYAYETGFAVKFLVAQWVASPFTQPWVGWGPYLWTDGIAGRADGLKWYCSDTADGTHPSPSGNKKVVSLMQSFFSKSEFSSWFRPPGSKPPSPGVDQTAASPNPQPPLLVGQLGRLPVPLPIAAVAIIVMAIIGGGYLLARRRH